MQISSRAVVAALALFLTGAVATVNATAVRESPAEAQQYRQWVEAMKTSERGPFARLRWFCSDGRVMPPRPYSCGDEGGHQHGEWSKQTKTLRDEGYKIANLLAGIDAGALTSEPDFIDSYNQLLIEKYLITADDGWILRRAMFYRGAIQEEDEAAGGRDLLVAMSCSARMDRSPLPGTGVSAYAWCQHGKGSASVQKVRQVSASLSDQDAGFKSLRGKIHGTPDAGDAQRVRDYADGVSDAAMKAKYLELADEIDRVYQAAPLAGAAGVACQCLHVQHPGCRRSCVTVLPLTARMTVPANRYQATATPAGRAARCHAAHQESIGPAQRHGYQPGG